MKKFFIIIFIFGYAFSNNITVKNDFLSYWKNIKENKIKINYNFELPYQRFLFSYKHYKKLVNQYEKNLQFIKITNIKCNKNKCIIYYLGYNKKYHYRFTDKDIWYNIENKWYHYFKYEKIF